MLRKTRRCTNEKTNLLGAGNKNIENQKSVLHNARAYSIMRDRLGYTPQLSQELWFKACCAALIEDMGFIPRGYCIDSANCIKKNKITPGMPIRERGKIH
jgi:hypothetical protein